MNYVTSIPMIHGATLTRHDDSKSALVNDEALTRRLRMRDKTAMADLLERHGSMMYRVAIRFVRNENAAREVLQDTLIAVWNKVGTFRGQAKLGTWLYRVTANAALMQLRKQRGLCLFVSLDNFENPDFVLQDNHDERPDAALLRSELGEHMQRAIDSLSESHHTIVILADVEGLSLAEIAKLTHESVPAVKSRLHRARLILRKELSPYIEARPRFAETATAFTEFCAA
jgi:RNA polymerase sigma-70 factor (ECF subfamily)